MTPRAAELLDELKHRFPCHCYDAESMDFKPTPCEWCELYLELLETTDD